MSANMNNTNHDAKCHSCATRCVSWSAVFMGALTAIALSFILNLLCLGIGLSAFPTTDNGALVFGVSGFIGLTVCAILSMFPAGFVAGKLARPFCTKRWSGELYGLAAWTVALIVSILLVASVGKFVNQATYVVTRQPVTVQLSNLANNETVQVMSRNNNATQTKVVIDPQKAADATAMTMFATFFIFFIGLLAACFGGRCAVMCCQTDTERCGYTK